MNYQKHQHVLQHLVHQDQPNLFHFLSQSNTSWNELKYVKSDTLQSLKAKNEKLHQMIIQLNNKVASALKQYKDLERSSQSEKIRIYEELEHISTNYKLYADSHKRLKLTEKSLKEFFADYTVITKELVSSNSMSNCLRKVFNEIYTRINYPLSNSNVFGLMLDLKKYVNDKWRMISLESSEKQLGLDIDVSYVRDDKLKDNRKANTCANEPNPLILSKVIDNPYKKKLFDREKRAITPETVSLNKTNDESIKPINCAISRKIINLTPLKLGKALSNFNNFFPDNNKLI